MAVVDNTDYDALNEKNKKIQEKAILEKKESSQKEEKKSIEENKEIAKEKPSEPPRVHNVIERQLRSYIKITPFNKKMLLIGGLLLEISSNISTLALCYSIADKSHPLAEYNGVLITGSVISWVARGIGIDIGKTILLPIGLSAFSKGMVFKSIPFLIIGSGALVFSMFASLGIVDSRANQEAQQNENNRIYIETNKQTMREIDAQINASNESERAAINASNELIRSSKGTHRTEVKNKRLSMSANAINNIQKLHSLNSNLLIRKLELNKKIVAENEGQLTGVYNGLKFISFGDCDNTPSPAICEKNNQEKTKSRFNIGTIVMEELLGILMLALGGNWSEKGFAGRKEDAEKSGNDKERKSMDENKKKIAKHPAKLYGERGVSLGEFGVSLGEFGVSLGEFGVSLLKKASNFIKKSTEESSEKTEHYDDVLTAVAIKEIQEGKLKSLSQPYIISRYKCGTKMAEAIKKTRACY
jgi:hypothetical protein